MTTLTNRVKLCVEVMVCGYVWCIFIYMEYYTNQGIFRGLL